MDKVGRIHRSYNCAPATKEERDENMELRRV